MLIGNRSAPLSVLLFATAQGVTDKNRHNDGQIDSPGTAARERARKRERLGGAASGRAECKRSTLGVFTSEKEYEKSMKT